MSNDRRHQNAGGSRWLMVAALGVALAPGCTCGGSDAPPHEETAAEPAPAPAPVEASAAETAASAPGTEAPAPAGIETLRGQQHATGANGANRVDLPPGWRIVPAGHPSQQRAAEARQSLATRLQSRLVEEMTAHGAASAVDVCSQEAIPIAEDVAKEYEVEIGRTSNRLRNPTNTAPDWAVLLAERRPTSALSVVREDGTYGELSPITVSAPCLNCHGDVGAMETDVLAALRERYPADEATGYAEGDLRGWFWVQVPPS